MLTFTGRLRVSATAVFAAGTILASCLPATAAERDQSLVARYAKVLGGANQRLKPPARRDLAQRVLLLTSYYRIDPRLLVALVSVESSWHARAVSPVGALGFGQLMPATAATLDVDALEPYENLDGTARYLRRLLNRFAGRDELTRVRLAIASYNAGPGAVDRYNGVPPYRETQAYVQTVIQRWRQLAAVVEAPVADFGALATSGTTTRARHVVKPAHVALHLAQHTPAPLIAQHRVATKRPAPRVAAVVWHPYHSPYLDALDPNSIPIETPAPVRYERSRSFIARLFGLRHRVVDAPATATPQPTTSDEPG